LRFRLRFQWLNFYCNKEVKHPWNIHIRSSTYCTTRTKTMAQAQEKFSKVPELAKPTNYKIHLKPCLKTFKFEGQETIQIEICKATDYLTLYSKMIDIHSSSLKLKDGTVINIEKDKMELDEKKELLTVCFPTKIAPQEANLDFTFTADLNDILRGFYRSSYKDKNGSVKYLASTQFESTFARMAFPCWDEPMYKACFDISLEVSPELTALSNMHAINESKTTSGNKILTFATTPKMSTYLVAFAVGDFDYIEDTAPKTGIQVRVFALPGKTEQCKFALEVAKKCFDWYTDWFGVPMPLKKCDLIAIPDFNMGVMENWGLITYREIILLFDPLKTSTYIKMRIALVIAHEIAHFWFGNLATMKWWTDLWLKEGFATFMEYLFTHNNYPEFKTMLEFLKAETSGGLNLDSLRNSHPIEMEIGNPCELDQIYDAITYNKGCCVNRMLFEYLGEPTFQKGLNNYLEKFKFGNAETADLWKCFGEVSGKDINGMMDSWIKQMGFPLVSVEQKLLDGNRRQLLMTQQRFLADGGTDEKKPVWKIPICLTTSANPTGQKEVLLMTEPTQTFDLEGVKPDEWIKLNSRTAGFFRVQYSESMLKPLLSAFGSKSSGRLNAIERFGIANDITALFESGKAPASQFLDLFIQCCEGEDEHMIWTVINGGLGTISNLLEHLEDGGKLKGRFNAFIRQNLEKHVNELGWVPKTGEDKETSLLRALIIGRIAKAGHKPTIEIALEKFGEYTNNGTELVADLRAVVFGIAARTNSKQIVESLKKILETVNFSEIEVHAIGALGQVTDEELLAGVYKYAIIDGKIRSQDTRSIFMGCCSSKMNQHFAWNFYKNNFDHLIKMFGTLGSTQVINIFKMVAGSHCLESVAFDVEKFFNEKLNESEAKVMKRPIGQATESIRLNARLLERNERSIDEYLTKSGY